MVDKGVHSFSPERLRAARERRRAETSSAGTWTQEDVAERLGILRINYLAWEHGRRTPSPPSLVRLAALLEVEPHELTNIPFSEASLVDLRQWVGLMQADVARELGVSRSQYAAIERGERRLSDSQLVALSDLYGRGHDEIRRAARLSGLEGPVADSGEEAL